MDSDFRLFPDQASAGAAGVDLIYFYLLSVSVFFTGLIFFLLIYFCIKYRRRPGRETGVQIKPRISLEIAWIAIPLVLVMIMFFWGASAFFPIYRPPSNALDVYVVGRQWMWKIQHAAGNPEINELHVPLGRPIRLTMTSQDVIHSFYVPAFRLKQDVLPGRYTTIWFEPTKIGEFHLFCAEYCGTKHSGMVGRVVVLSPADYERWLATGISQGSLASGGHRLFLSLGCAACHTEDVGAQGPNLTRLSGSRVLLQGGGETVADENYLRESILDPAAKLVAGFQPIMPAFRGKVSEDDLLRLVSYLKALGTPEKTARDE
jgi:cytochrome c oxidase subunit 2